MPNLAIQQQHHTATGQWFIMADRRPRSLPVAVNLRRRMAPRSQVQEFNRFADRFRLRSRDSRNGDRQNGEDSARPGSCRRFNSTEGMRRQW